MGRDVTPPRILAVDDDERMRELVSAALQRGGFDAIALADGAALLAAAETEEPAGVVLDVNLPEVSGYELCEQLRRRYGNGLAIVFLSGDRVESYDRVAGLLVGADDYVTKPFAPDELVARVRRLVERAAVRVKKSTLTTREGEVLALLAEGLEQSEIAQRLIISPKTVATHIEHVLVKLGAHSRAQAVAIAYREGLVANS